jgi:hypothetical protein
MVATKKKPWKTGASSGHITNLKQSFFFSFDVYVRYPCLRLFTFSIPKQHLDLALPPIGHLKAQKLIHQKKFQKIFLSLGFTALTNYDQILNVVVLSR